MDITKRKVSVNFSPHQAVGTVETSDLLINLIFQGRSSDHFESVQPVVSAASSKIEERYSSGLMLFIIAHSIRENNRHVDLAPSSEPQNKKFFLDKTYGRIERSATEFNFNNFRWLLQNINTAPLNEACFSKSFIT